jgi:NADH dehydrogenase (ubiquinone) 1 alpha subcomplex subunit 13
MKDVKGWQTGTWFGEPVYKTNKNFDKWVSPTIYDVYSHTNEKEIGYLVFTRNSGFH